MNNKQIIEKQSFNQDSLYKYLRMTVLLTEKIETLNQEMKELKEKKDKLEELLIPRLLELDLDKKAILYKEKKIYVKGEKVYPHLSYKYINEKLNKYFKNRKSDLVDDICQYLKDERVIKENNVLIIK